MTNRQVCGLRILLLAAVLLLPLLAIPAFPDAFHRDGVRYSSPGEIEEAQRILEAEHYLQAGLYAPGVMDQDTIDALHAFQQAHFTPSNGTLDQDTMALLLTHYSAPAAPVEPVAAAPVQEAPKVSEPAKEEAPVEPMPVVQAMAEPETETAPAEEPPAERTMPATASPVPLMACLGAMLLGAGLLIVRHELV